MHVALVWYTCYILSSIHLTHLRTFGKHWEYYDNIVEICLNHIRMLYFDYKTYIMLKHISIITTKNIGPCFFEVPSWMLLAAGYIASYGYTVHSIFPYALHHILLFQYISMPLILSIVMLFTWKSIKLIFLQYGQNHE